MARKKLIRLYETDDGYTPEARRLAKQIQKILMPHVVRMARRGYSLRDVESVINAEVGVVCMLHLLLGKTKRARRRKA